MVINPIQPEQYAAQIKQGIKKFHISKKAPTIENGEMTPSMKLRRHVILENYKEAIDNLYE